MKKINAATLVVADTSGLMSLVVDTDANHEKVLAQSQVFDESPGAVVIFSHVFTELMNVLRKKLGHQVAVAAGQQILVTPHYLIIESDEDLTEALERFSRQPSSVSFTDYLVMALADRLRTKLIFGFDEAFAKNGYQFPEAPKKTTRSLKREDFLPFATENVHSANTYPFALRRPTSGKRWCRSSCGPSKRTTR